MKAILVVGIPDGYGDVYDNKAIVTLRNGKLGTSLEIFNVSLRPLPMKKETDETEPFDVYMYKTGWNLCLEAIGETE